jgi:hypothetical protein
MLRAPYFESAALVTDDALLAARLSALFVRPGRYFPVLDGPRLSRPDASNEVVRRRNAVVMTGARKVLLGNLSPQAAAAMRPGWENCTVANGFEDHVLALSGTVKRPRRSFQWGTSNVGVGLLTLPLFPALHRLGIMRTSCLAAGPRSSVAQTSSG